MKQNKLNRIKKIITIIVLSLFIFGFIKLLPIFMSLTSEEGRIAFSNDVQNLGIKGALVIIFLTVCKIILVFLPGEPIELASGMCYGAINGIIVIYIGVILSNLLIIYLVNKYGSKLVNNIVPEDKRLKITNMINKHPNGSEIALIALYFLPILPKDFITYVASILPIPTKKLLFISILGRFPSVFSSALCGSQLIQGKIGNMLIIYAVTYVISTIMVYLYKKFEKKWGKETSE